MNPNFAKLIDSSPTFSIQDSFIKGYGKIHGYDDSDFRQYDKIMVSISGGSDSDILMDYCERIGYPEGTLKYVFFDTGMEFEATKRHLDFLEQKYGLKFIENEQKFQFLLDVENTVFLFYQNRQVNGLVDYNGTISSGRTNHLMYS